MKIVREKKFVWGGEGRKKKKEKMESERSLEKEMIDRGIEL